MCIILSPNLVSCYLKHELHPNYCLHVIILLLIDLFENN
jgi:hypothetical protein